MLEIWKLWYRCESIVKFILVISCFQVFQHPVQSVLKQTQQQQMQFISLPQLIDIAREYCQNWVQIGWTRTVCRASIVFSTRCGLWTCWYLKWSSGQTLNATWAHLLGFQTSGISHMKLQQGSLLQGNPQPRQPTEGNIVSGNHQHDRIPSGTQVRQDFWVGPKQFALRNAIPI